MKIVIDVPDFIYKALKEDVDCGTVNFNHAIVNGTPYEERPQGEWIENVERRGCFAGDKTVYSYTCPFCGAIEFKKYPFCHCGADLRGDKE